MSGWDEHKEAALQRQQQQQQRGYFLQAAAFYRHSARAHLTSPHNCPLNVKCVNKNKVVHNLKISAPSVDNSD